MAAKVLAEANVWGKAGLIGAMALILAGCQSLPQTLYARSGDVPGSVVLEDGTVMRHLAYIPKTLQAGHRAPVIVFLHGSGEAGTDVYKLLANGPWDYANRHDDFPFIILAPQMEVDADWDTERLEAWLDGALKTLPVDSRRIYLTGLSRGGQGTWDFAMAHPEHFAAVAPVSAYSSALDHGFSPCAIKGIPVWAFHGAEDDVVPLKDGQKVVDAARACGVEVDFTIYPGLGHSAWGPAYQDADLYAFFLRHRRHTPANAQGLSRVPPDVTLHPPSEPVRP